MNDQDDVIYRFTKRELVAILERTARGAAAATQEQYAARLADVLAQLHALKAEAAEILAPFRDAPAAETKHDPDYLH